MRALTVRGPYRGVSGYDVPDVSARDRVARSTWTASADRLVAILAEATEAPAGSRGRT